MFLLAPLMLPHERACGGVRGKVGALWGKV